VDHQIEELPDLGLEFEALGLPFVHDDLLKTGQKSTAVFAAAGEKPASCPKSLEMQGVSIGA
jgi:hypothetical protein